MAKKRPSAETAPISVPLEWHVGENVSTVYANHLAVQRGEYECVLLFFEQRAPMLMGTPDEQRAQMKRLSEVRAECVARVVISPSRLPFVIKALQAAQNVAEEGGDESRE
ncbi:MAG: hypothetical protein ACYC35_17190 [Pirellulales bacterium]